jgi:glycosidase
VIVDGVFNHVGTTFWAFKDVREKGRESRYKDWFNITRWDDPSTPADEFDYHGWIGTKDLPEFRKDENGPLTGPREHIRAIVRRWMDPDGDGDPSDGVDGWRLDVAEMVPLPFWREFRQWVRGINPEAYITGEVWWEDWSKGKMFNSAPWLQGDAFDAVMNYRFAREVCHFFKDREKKISASEFDRRLREIRGNYRSEANDVLMNLLDSHDTDRLGSMIVNVDSDYDKRAGPTDNPDYDVRKPNADELKTQKLMVLFQMTYLGAPMVYYGDEAGMWGGDDPDERKPMLWSEFTYANEASHPFGKPRPNDVNAFNQDLFDFYKEAIALRRSLPALSRGIFVTLTKDDTADVYGFLRSHASSHVAVVLNNGSREHTVTLKVPKGVKPAGWKYRFPRDIEGTLALGGKVVVPAKSGVVLETTAR